MDVTGTPKNFSYTLSTSATKEAFWHVWTDVATWPTWDTPLKAATLEGEMSLGTKGTLTTQAGQKSSFTITEYEPLQRYAFTTRLPGARLVVRRYFSGADEALQFTHNVTFEGPFGFIFAALLGRGFMRDLPPVMEHLRKRVEAG